MKNHSGESDKNRHPGDEIAEIFPNLGPAVAQRERKNQNERGDRGEEQRNVFGVIAELIDRVRQVDVEGEKADVKDGKEFDPDLRAEEPAAGKWSVYEQEILWFAGKAAPLRMTPALFILVTLVGPALGIRWKLVHKRPQSLRLAMLSLEFGGQGAEFNRFLEHRIVAVPLDEVGTAHERAVLAGAAVIVPKIEIDEVNRLRERRATQCAVFAQTIDQVLRGFHANIRGLYDLFGLAVDAVDERRGMALRADLLHLGLGGGVVGAPIGNGVGEIVRKALGGIVSDPNAIDAAHVAGGAGGHEHVAGGQSFGWGIEIQQIFLGLEDNTVLGLFIDLDLRVVGPHVALGASAGQAGDADGAGVTGVAVGAVADGAIGVGPANAVTLLAAAGHGRSALERDERMRRTAGASWLIGFGKIHLLGGESFFAIDGGPGGSGMAAAEELLVDAFVAAAAISRGELGGDDEAVVVFLVLSGRGLVALKAVDAFAGVRAHLVFVHDGVLGALVALGAFSGGADQSGRGLFGFHLGTGAIEEKRSKDQREGDDEGEEDRTKRHWLPLGMSAPRPRTRIHFSGSDGPDTRHAGYRT